MKYMADASQDYQCETNIMKVHVKNITHRAIVFNNILFGNVKNNLLTSIALLIFDILATMSDDERR